MNTVKNTETPEKTSLARDPNFQLTLTRAMLETLDLPHILYVILSGITAGDGLRFNRAFLFLVDNGGRLLSGKMAIGPRDPVEAHRIWEAMEQQRFDLETLMKRYQDYSSDTQASSLSLETSKLTYPIPLDENNTPESFRNLLRKVFVEKVPVIRNDIMVPIEDTSITLCNFLMSPLLMADNSIGVLVCDNAFNRRVLTEDDVADVLSLANLAAIAVERARLHERIRRMAERDGLTELANRRIFDQLLSSKFKEAQERNTPLSLVFIDLDDFKSINDTYGHLAGDDLLREVAAIIRSRIRRGDIAARYGGDELAILLPGATAEQAAGIAEHIRDTTASTNFGKPGDTFTASMSIGVAEMTSAHKTSSDLLAETDGAVYEAKNNGKNQVMISKQSHCHTLK